MKRNGNTKTNRTFNPQNTKPPIPLDVDEVDAVLERFIRQKYDQQLFSEGHSRAAVRNNTGSTRSSEDQPPPLPPKPGKRFGFGLRSASSAFPLPKNGPMSPPLSPSSPNSFDTPASPIRVNKQSRVFGASVGTGGDDMEAKLAQLRDMGFADEKRNATILKGLGGNLDKAIESLVRLGEGSAPNSRSRTPNQSRNNAVSQPLPTTAQSAAVVNGISFVGNGAMSQASTGSQGQQTYQSTNPPQPQAMRSSSSANPFQTQPQAHNPFGPPNQQQSNATLENAFQGMQISQQPLFPNNTGGYPSQPPPQPDTRFQTMTPPVPQVPQQYIQSNPYTQQNVAINDSNNPFFHTQPTASSTNPYASNIQPQVTQPTQPLYIYQQPPLPLSTQANGYSNQSPQIYSPQVQNPPFQQQVYQQQPLQQQAVSNLFTSQHPTTDPIQYATQTQQQPLPNFGQYQPQPLQPQQTGRVDKTSILALYNYPQLAPPPLPSDANVNPSTETSMHNLPQSPPMKQAQRSATMPMQLASGSKNPFQASTANATATNGNLPDGGRHVSHDSMNGGGYQNGRHSPDAFASLSARFVR